MPVRLRPESCIDGCAVGRDAEWYPGYSEMAELAETYRLAHLAATDPGSARVALVSDGRLRRYATVCSVTENEPTACAS
ncbi:hypothetical protein B0H19DRAFT_1233881, partial [Mycena capillaripes]